MILSIGHVIDIQQTVTLFLFRLHYITSTNCGFCQGNMTWCHKVRGKSYHWIIDLYSRLQLPVIPAIIQALQKEVEDRMTEIEKGRTDHTKKIRVQMKVARAEEQEERKRWVKRQRLQHTYGHNEDDGDNEQEDPRLVNAAREVIEGAEQNDGAAIIISGKACKCGSRQHQRTTHSACPLNKRGKK